MRRNKLQCWGCTSASGPTVKICTTWAVEEHWAIILGSDWSGNVKSIYHRDFTNGVVNIQSTIAELERTADSTSCSAYFVDGHACTSCGLCVDTEGNLDVVADCTNVVDGAVSNCEQKDDFLKRLLVLESAISTATIAVSTERNGIFIGDGISIIDGNNHIIMGEDGISIIDGDSQIELNSDGISINNGKGHV